MTITRIDSTTVRVSWTLKNGHEGVQFFLVVYYKKEDGSDRHTKNTTETEITIHGLDPDAEYEFVVSLSFLLFLFPFNVVVNKRLVSCPSFLDQVGNGTRIRYPLQNTLANIVF